MENRSANGQLEHLDNLASELARLPVDMFVAGGDAPILAAMRASDTIPIVMTLAADPIRSGFIPIRSEAASSRAWHVRGATSRE